MKIETPKTLEEFLLVLKTYYNCGTNYYRGQADYSWKITPGLARNQSITNINNLLKVENNLNQQFDKLIQINQWDKFIPIVKNTYHKSWVNLMAAQHYGLPTRLLDFSNDKFTALQFAVDDIQNSNKDGAFIIYNNVNEIHEDVDSPMLKNQFSQTHDSFFFQVPSFWACNESEFSKSESRKRIQGSKFLYQNTENLFNCLSLDIKHSHKITIIHIPKTIKLAIIKWLIDVGRMPFDLYNGKNIIDYYTAILRCKFTSIDYNNIDDATINNESFWKI